MHQNCFRLGLCPDPAGGAYDAPSDPLVGWGGGRSLHIPLFSSPSPFGLSIYAIFLLPNTNSWLRDNTLCTHCQKILAITPMSVFVCLSVSLHWISSSLSARASSVYNDNNFLFAAFDLSAFILTWSYIKRHCSGVSCVRIYPPKTPASLQASFSIKLTSSTS